MYTDDYTDEISELVEEAHAIFSATTVTEVMDMRDRQSQEDFLNKIQGVHLIFLPIQY